MGFDWGGFPDDGFYKRLQEISLQDRQMMEDGLKNMERKREREQLLDGALTGIRDNTEYLKRLEELSRIADTADLRAKLAQDDARKAKKDALFSKILSILSLMVSIISVIVQFLTR